MHIVAGGALDGGERKVGQVAGDDVAGVRGDLEMASAGLEAAFDAQGASVGEHQAQGMDPVARGAVMVAQRAGGVAGQHASDRGGGFRGIGRKEETMGLNSGADIGQQGAGLHGDTVAVMQVADVAHAGEVQDQAPFRDGAGGDAGAGALDGHGPLVGAGVPQRRADVGFVLREGNGHCTAGAAGFIVEIILKLRAERNDSGGRWRLLHSVSVDNRNTEMQSAGQQ